MLVDGKVQPKSGSYLETVLSLKKKVIEKVIEKSY